jgi:hypothetical protein
MPIDFQSIRELLKDFKPALVMYVVLVCDSFIAMTLSPSVKISWSMTISDLESLTSTFEHLATVTALILGGIWTYFKFIKERVFISRLETSVSGEIIKIGNVSHLRISVSLKNVGSSKVELTQRGVSLNIFHERFRLQVPEIEAQQRRVRSVPWKYLAPFNVLERHAWIEPGETIRDQQLVELLTNDKTAYKVEFIIFARGTKWTATTIVSPSAPSMNKTEGDLTTKEDSDV